MAMRDERARSPRRETRRALAELLKRRGPLSAAELAAELGVTAMAARQHLQALEASGDVASASEPEGVGRPTKVYRLLPRAQRLFPDRHRDLALELIECLDAAQGEGAVARLLEERRERQAARYRERLRAGSGLRGKVQALAELRSEEGYMAEVERGEDGSWLLVENHCPIRAAAETCPGLCQNELALFREVLGPGVRVDRVEHALGGARRCAYCIAISGAVSAERAGSGEGEVEGLPSHLL